LPLASRLASCRAGSGPHHSLPCEHLGMRVRQLCGCHRLTGDGRRRAGRGGGVRWWWRSRELTARHRPPARLIRDCRQRGAAPVRGNRKRSANRSSSQRATPLGSWSPSTSSSRSYAMTAYTSLWSSLVAAVPVRPS
jgi:hypothetical protein